MNDMNIVLLFGAITSAVSFTLLVALFAIMVKFFKNDISKDVVENFTALLIIFIVLFLICVAILTGGA